MRYGNPFALLPLVPSTIVPSSAREMTRSGVALFDDWLGGLRDGGVHLLTGGPGSGKSSLAFHLADAGCRNGERVVMLVHARTDDVKAHARWLGIDLDTSLDKGDLLLLRYRADFMKAVAHTVCPDDIVTDLERLIAPHRPTRIVIDTFSPFLLAPPPVASVVAALVELLRRTGATSLLTFPEDVESGYDRSLEPLISEAAAVIRLVREDNDVRRAELLNIRYPAPESMTARFVIRQHTGSAVQHSLRLERPALRVT